MVIIFVTCDNDYNNNIEIAIQILISINKYVDTCSFYWYHHDTDTVPNHWYSGHWSCMIISCTCIIITRTLILPVLVSCSTPDTPVHWHRISGKHLLHWILLFHVLVSSLHCCYITPNIVISYTCITITWILLM